MATIPVFACRVCGTPVFVTHLSTNENDPSNEKLKLLMSGLSKIALCDRHRKVKNYYASQGREDEFIREQLNPTGVIYNVRDHSGLEYYKKGDPIAKNKG